MFSINEINEHAFKLHLQLENLLMIRNKADMVFTVLTDTKFKYKTF